MDSRLLWVCVGGAAGSGARYLVSEWAQRSLGVRFPYGTLIVNATGSFLLGALMAFAFASERLSPTVRVALAAGVLGGFTTYSSFCYETLSCLQQGAWARAALYVAATLIGCLAACALGFWLARQIAGA